MSKHIHVYIGGTRKVTKTQDTKHGYRDFDLWKSDAIKAGCVVKSLPNGLLFTAQKEGNICGRFSKPNEDGWIDSTISKAKDEYLNAAPKSPVAYKGFSLYAGTDGDKNSSGQYKYKWYLSSRLGDGLNGYFETAQALKDAIDKVLVKYKVDGFSAFKKATKDAESYTIKKIAPGNVKVMLGDKIIKEFTGPGAEREAEAAVKKLSGMKDANLTGSINSGEAKQIASILRRCSIDAKRMSNDLEALARLVESGEEKISMPSVKHFKDELLAIRIPMN